jgi:membrane fusion protein, heavy metal efflux system
MKPGFAIIVLTVVAVAGLSFVWMPRDRSPELQATGTVKAEQPSAGGSDWIELSEASMRESGIEVRTVESRSLPETFESTGRVQLNEDASARVGSFVPGRVARVLATVGDRVSAGQPLVYIHSHELIDARATAIKAESGRRQAENALIHARAELDRASRLLEAKAISVREQLQAVANSTASEAALKAAEAEVDRSNEFLDHLGATEKTEEVVVRSPIGGVILERNVTTGTVVSQSDDLMVVADLSNVWVVAEVPERAAGAIRAGLPVEVSVAAFDEAFRGQVVYLGESLDPQTRTLRVRCLLSNAQRKLRPEMYATIRMELGRTGNVIAVPAASVQDVAGSSIVFIEDSPGRFRKRVVKTGRTAQGMIEIAEGLKAGERIVTSGSFLLKSEMLQNAVED